MTNSIKIFSSILFYFILTLNSISQTIESEPFFSVERGFYDENFSLTISSNVGGSDIYYTLDGSDPSTSLSRIINPSPVQIYINPLNTANRYLAPGVIVRACVFNSGEQISEVITHSYFFINKIRETSPDDVKPGSGWWNTNYSDYSRQFINYGLDPDVYNDPAYSSQFEDSFLSVPTLSLVTDLKNLFDVNTGIYVNPFNHGDEWERLASLELINPDGSDGFQINCGIRIRGGWSRHFDNPKHAFRVFFSSDYGPTKLNFPLFGNEGTDEFDKIDLRTSQNYSWAFYGDSRNTMLRDVFSRDTQREMVKPYTRSRYYHLYINGVYWGLFQTQERSEASYAEEYLGGEREDYDVVKVDVGEDFNLYEIEATDGNLSAYNNLWQACNEGFDDDENFLKMQGLNPDGSRNPDYDILLDVDNLIDYMLCTFYVGDFDGPISSFSGNTSPNNFYGIYNRVDQDGFKFFRHDAEHSLFNQPQGIDRTGPYPAGEQFVHFNPQWLHQKLVENDEYIVRFTDMVYEHFYNSGVLTPNSSIDRLLSRKEEIETAIIAESARWGDSKSSSPKTKLDDWQPEVNFLVYSYLPNRTNLVLEQLKSKGWYPDFNPPQFNLEAGIVPPGSELELTAEGTIYYTVDGTDPHKYPMPGGESFTLIDFSDTKKVFVPEFDIGNSWRSEIGYNETGWLSTSGLPGGIGYEQGTGYDEFISLNVAGYMYNDGSNPSANTSCYIRIPFEISSDIIDSLVSLKINLQYDDGFAAYINNSRVAEVLAPSTLSWNSNASGNHEGDFVESFNISDHIDHLQPGTNLLAIHSLNVSNTSSDFLMRAELIASTGSPVGISPTAIEYTSPVILNTTTEIRTRSINNERWSALNKSIFTVNEDFTSIKVTEVHYNPLESTSVEGTEYEFIELKNTGSSQINLTGCSFIDGITFTFSTGASIEPNEFIVLSSNAVEFQNRYGFMPDGEYEGQLSNGGELITLVNSASETILSFEYNDSEDWPQSADGLGNSIVSVNPNPTGDPSQPSYWRASTQIHGSPGEDDLESNISPVIINEVLTHTDYPQVDAVEIYNPNLITVDISNWYLTDDIANPTKWKIPPGSAIQPEGYIVFYEGHYIADSLQYDENEFGSEFSLSAHGDFIYIYSANEDGALTGFAHGRRFGEISNGVSIGRYINSEGEDHFVAQTQVTLGEENSDPRVGPLVISRINYNPDSLNYEVLTIKNITSEIIPLYDLANTANTWKVDGISFEFPPTTVLGANASIYLVENTITVNQFRDRYNIDEDTLVFNFSGSLDNAGETITLSRPAEPFTVNGELIIPYEEIDKVKYDDKSPWPEEADGGGKGLIRIDLTKYGSESVNWRAGDVVTSIQINDDDKLPVSFKLYQNYPNPFNPSTIITYQIPDARKVKLKVYDILGNEIITLVNEYQSAGLYEVAFNSNDVNVGIASGVYIYRIRVGEFSASKKFVFMK